jgi:hypothetical protein
MVDSHGGRIEGQILEHGVGQQWRDAIDKATLTTFEDTSTGFTCEILVTLSRRNI